MQLSRGRPHNKRSTDVRRIKLCRSKKKEIPSEIHSLAKKKQPNRWTCGRTDVQTYDTH